MANTGDTCPTKICCNPKGPIIVEGDVNIVDKYGRPLCPDKKKKSHVLCGCGQSMNKPFCDGKHNKAGGGEDEDDEDVSN